MNKEQSRKAIEVMQAWVDGEPIQYKSRDEKAWHDFVNDTLCGWDWYGSEYRKKPQPKIVERWVLGDSGGTQITCRTLDDARRSADYWDAMGHTGITLTHLTGEEQPWQK